MTATLLMNPSLVDRRGSDTGFAALSRADRLGGAAPQTPRDIFTKKKGRAAASAGIDLSMIKEGGPV